MLECISDAVDIGLRKTAGDLGNGKSFIQQTIEVVQRINVAIGQQPSDATDWMKVDKILMQRHGIRPHEIGEMTLIEIMMYLEPIDQPPTQPKGRIGFVSG